MATIAQINSDYDAYRTALIADNYSLAIKYLMLMKGAMVTIPESSKRDASLKFDPNTIDSLIADCRKLATSNKTSTTAGLRRFRFQRERTGDAI